MNTEKGVSVILEHIIFHSALLAFRDMSHLRPIPAALRLGRLVISPEIKLIGRGKRNTTSMQTFLKKKKQNKEGQTDSLPHLLNAC